MISHLYSCGVFRAQWGVGGCVSALLTFTLCSLSERESTSGCLAVPSLRYKGFFEEGSLGLTHMKCIFLAGACSAGALCKNQEEGQIPWFPPCLTLPLQLKECNTFSFFKRV